MTTRNQKVLDLIIEANQLAIHVQAGADAFYGNQGVSVYSAGSGNPKDFQRLGYPKAGDVVGTLLQLAGILPQVDYDVTDPKEALALGLDCKVQNLSQELQGAVNNLVSVADNTKRSYSRRRPKLVKALRAFAVALNTAVTLPTTGLKRRGAPVTVTFSARGVVL